MLELRKGQLFKERNKNPYVFYLRYVSPKGEILTLLNIDLSFRPNRIRKYKLSDYEQIPCRDLTADQAEDLACHERANSLEKVSSQS